MRQYTAPPRLTRRVQAQVSRLHGSSYRLEMRSRGEPPHTRQCYDDRHATDREVGGLGEEEGLIPVADEE